jgi:hypothetical protein
MIIWSRYFAIIIVIIIVLAPNAFPMKDRPLISRPSNASHEHHDSRHANTALPPKPPPTIDPLVVQQQAPEHLKQLESHRFLFILGSMHSGECGYPWKSIFLDRFISSSSSSILSLFNSC